MRELAERFGVSFDYVKKIRKHQLRYGQMERREQQRHGPVSRMTAEAERQLRELVRSQPDFTLEELRQHLRRQAKVEFGKSSVAIYLERLGLRRKKNAARQ